MQECTAHEWGTECPVCGYDEEADELDEAFRAALQAAFDRRS